MNKIFTHSIITACLLSTLSIADEIAAPVEAKVADVEAQYSGKSVEASDKLKQSINVGFSNTSGNTDTTNLNATYKMSFTTEGYNKEKLKVAFDATAFLNESNNTTNNEEYTANLGVEQYITTDGWLGYGSLNWLRNPEFRNFDNKFSVGAGVGKELFNDGIQSFKIKIGGAYNIQQYADNTEDAKFASVNEYAEYMNVLNSTSALYLRVGAMQNVEDFENDYEVLGVLGLGFAVAESVFVNIQEEVSYDKIHPGTAKATDTKSIVSVGYNF